MNESGLGIYGTSYKTMIQTTRENTIYDHLFFQTSYQKQNLLQLFFILNEYNQQKLIKFNCRIRTKTGNESSYKGFRIGTTTFQSHRSRFQSTQQDARQQSSTAYQSYEYKGCKNYKCLEMMSDLQEVQDQNLQTIRTLTQEIERLKREIQQNNKMIINQDKLKERLISTNSRVWVQKSLGLFGQSLESNQNFKCFKN